MKSLNIYLEGLLDKGNKTSTDKEGTLLRKLAEIRSDDNGFNDGEFEYHGDTIVIHKGIFWDDPRYGEVLNEMGVKVVKFKENGKGGWNHYVRLPRKLKNLKIITDLEISCHTYGMSLEWENIDIETSVKFMPINLDAGEIRFTNVNIHHTNMPSPLFEAKLSMQCTKWTYIKGGSCNIPLQFIADATTNPGPTKTAMEVIRRFNKVGNTTDKTLVKKMDALLSDLGDYAPAYSFVCSKYPKQNQLVVFDHSKISVDELVIASDLHTFKYKNPFEIFLIYKGHLV